MATILLSIKPRYAEEILAGTKKYEFRKCLFRDVDRILLYATVPVGKVVGEVSVDGILETCTPENVWEEAKEAAGISYEEYCTYYRAHPHVVAYKLKNPVRYDKPKSLSDYGKKYAPRSAVYLPFTKL